MEDHQLKLLSDRDLQSEHSRAVRTNNGALASQLQAELDKRSARREEKPAGGTSTPYRSPTSKTLN